MVVYNTEEANNGADRKQKHSDSWTHAAFVRWIQLTEKACSGRKMTLYGTESNRRIGRESALHLGMDSGMVENVEKFLFQCYGHSSMYLFDLLVWIVFVFYLGLVKYRTYSSVFCYWSSFIFLDAIYFINSYFWSKYYRSDIVLHWIALEILKWIRRSPFTDEACVIDEWQI